MDEQKRPRDEEFQPEVKRPVVEKQAPDEFEKHKQKPLAILAIIAAGIIFAVVALFIYQLSEKNQHTIINVLPTDMADEKEKAEPTVQPSENAVPVSFRFDNEKDSFT